MLYPPKFGNDPLFPQEQDFRVMFKDNTSGQGVFTFRAFAKGEIIAKMAGEVIEEIRQHTLQINETQHLFDRHFSGYFLHACDPNISLNMEEMTVTALKDIPANSWLFMDYAETEDHLFKQFPCSCGSYNCRGWIGGKLDHLPQQKRPSMLGDTLGLTLETA
ncbi:MAG: SET domain-containing protein-lysine N-methyltransferase [Gammaproteobacteria bacterium]|nr:SET domain-containing protein-lysine N-methyltransferase [Gammaproteobacteria bacterium]